MCGIAGLVGCWGPDAEVDLGRMLDTLAPRGPDDRGTFVGDGGAIGMTRLSIIDIAGGHQPKVGGKGSWRVVFNGEIYNFRELRSKLASVGYQFSSRSDSEVVAHAVDHWGTGAFRRFDGMFAIAAWNPLRRRLLLARDRFGEKPLYVSESRGTLAFASELKALLAVLPRRTVSPSALKEFLHLGYVPAPRSILEEAEKLPPGSVAEWDGSELTTESFWSVDDVPEGVQAPEDPVGELGSRLIDAVATRLVADVEVGVLLSGGIDSSLVAWAAAQHGTDLHTFSVAFEDERRDESPYARAVADRLGTRHHETLVTADEARRVIPDLAGIYDEPLADHSTIPTLIVSRFAASHVKVALGGDGGDELFSGYPRYAELRALRWLQRVIPAPAAVADALGGRAALRSRGAMVLSLLGSELSDAYRNRAAFVPRSRLEWATVDSDGWRHVAADHQLPEDASPYRGARLTDLCWYLPDDLLVKVDRASMSTSLEVRSPFLAPALSEWALGLPDDVIGRPGRKALPRQLAREVLPAAVAGKRKQGFSVPLADWLRGPLRREIAEVIDDGVVIGDGVVRREAVACHLRALDAGHRQAARFLWSLYVYERWYQRWMARPLATQSLSNTPP